MLSALAQYCAHAGDGTPAPVQTISAADWARPVAARACATRSVDGWFRNSPMPPRITVDAIAKPRAPIPPPPIPPRPPPPPPTPAEQPRARPPRPASS